jgi:hypothetical protein
MSVIRIDLGPNPSRDDKELVMRGLVEFNESQVRGADLNDT